MTQPLLVARNLTLRVPVIKSNDRHLLRDPAGLLSNLYFAKTKRGMVTILDRISLTLYPGMRLGLIGANGAGKSTLLRVLAGIYAPTIGSLTVNGTVKGLFDISLGMNPAATGLENIYLRGLQMGLELSEIKSLIPEVIAFSELEDHIDQPFNTYSTGMRLRLSVSISTMVEPNILILDEWIGTGDARFSDKVEKRMNKLVENSRGLVLATHNISLMTKLCTDAIVLHNGKIAFSGSLENAKDWYRTSIQSATK